MLAQSDVQVKHVKLESPQNGVLSNLEQCVKLALRTSATTVVGSRGWLSSCLMVDREQGMPYCEMFVARAGWTATMFSTMIILVVGRSWLSPTTLMGCGRAVSRCS